MLLFFGIYPEYIFMCIKHVKIYGWKFTGWEFSGEGFAGWEFTRGIFRVGIVRGNSPGGFSGQGCGLVWPGVGQCCWVWFSVAGLGLVQDNFIVGNSEESHDQQLTKVVHRVSWTWPQIDRIEMPVQNEPTQLSRSYCIVRRNQTKSQENFISYRHDHPNKQVRAPAIHRHG